MRNFSAKEKSPSTANGPPLRCGRCNQLGHVASRYTDFNKFSPSSVKTVLSCFNCGREGHLARNCRQRPAHKVGVGRDTRFKAGTGGDTGDFSRTQNKGWFRSGNDRRELSSNPMTARRSK
jgi:hypothetical protein